MKTKKGLVVCDVCLNDLLKEYFKENSHLEIAYHAFNGIKALEILQKHECDIDFILVDFGLTIDEIAFFEVLKKLNIDKKIIVMTESKEESLIPKMLEYGIHYFMLKPFSMEDLEERILKLFEKQEPSSINLKEENVRFRITNLLREVGMPATLKGYYYLRDAIFLVIENPEFLGSVTKQLYPQVASHFASNASSVERSMRHAIEISFHRGNLEKIEEIFRFSMDSNKAKPTNSEFISMLAEKINHDIKMEELRV